MTEKDRKRNRPRRTKDTFACPHCRESITLVGTKEAISLLGLEYGRQNSTWQHWRESEGFPQPLWDAGQGGLWRKEDLLAWHKRREDGRRKDALAQLATLDERGRERYFSDLLKDERNEALVRRLLTNGEMRGGA